MRWVACAAVGSLAECAEGSPSAAQVKHCCGHLMKTRLTCCGSGAAGPCPAGFTVSAETSFCSKVVAGNITRAPPLPTNLPGPVRGKCGVPTSRTDLAARQAPACLLGTVTADQQHSLCEQTRQAGRAQAPGARPPPVCVQLPQVKHQAMRTRVCWTNKHECTTPTQVCACVCVCSAGNPSVGVTSLSSRPRRPTRCGCAAINCLESGCPPPPRPRAAAACCWGARRRLPSGAEHGCPLHGGPLQIVIVAQGDLETDACISIYEDGLRVGCFGE